MNLEILQIVVVLLGFTISVCSFATIPRWAVRSAYRHRLWRLRDDIVNDVLDGRLPSNQQVLWLLNSVESSIVLCGRSSMPQFIFMKLLLHRLPSDAQTRIRTQAAADHKIEGAANDLFQQRSKHMSILMTGWYLTGSWLGLAVVLYQLPRTFLHAYKLVQNSRRKSLIALDDAVSAASEHGLGRSVARGAAEAAMMQSASERTYATA